MISLASTCEVCLGTLCTYYNITYFKGSVCHSGKYMNWVHLCSRDTKDDVLCVNDDYRFCVGVDNVLDYDDGWTDWFWSFICSSFSWSFYWCINLSCLCGISRSCYHFCGCYFRYWCHIYCIWVCLFCVNSWFKRFVLFPFVMVLFKMWGYFSVTCYCLFGRCFTGICCVGTPVTWNAKGWLFSQEPGKGHIFFPY